MTPTAFLLQFSDIYVMKHLFIQISNVYEPVQFGVKIGNSITVNN